jgi:hypothetical protein
MSGKKNLDTLCRCDNCGHEDNAGDHDPAEISDLPARVEPGGTMPAGQCVKCKSLTYLVRNPVHQDLAELLRKAARMLAEDAISDELKAEADQLWEVEPEITEEDICKWLDEHPEGQPLLNALVQGAINREVDKARNGGLGFQLSLLEKHKMTADKVLQWLKEANGDA